MNATVFYLFSKIGRFAQNKKSPKKAAFSFKKGLYFKNKNAIIIQAPA